MLTQDSSLNLSFSNVRSVLPKGLFTMAEFATKKSDYRGKHVSDNCNDIQLNTNKNS